MRAVSSEGDERGAGVHGGETDTTTLLALQVAYSNYACCVQ